jgi:hypothetical protein
LARDLEANLAFDRVKPNGSFTGAMNLPAPAHHCAELPRDCAVHNALARAAVQRPPSRRLPVDRDRKKY